MAAVAEVAVVDVDAELATGDVVEVVVGEEFDD